MVHCKLKAFDICCALCILWLIISFCPCFKAKFQKSNKEIYIIFYLFNESEGDMEEEREDEE